ncbi:MAG: Gfo/Idh/MocA family oxidoreductase [Candidatus Bathyarchaeota archaeon]|nr:Gfo/Idh/MocA family oxidoreductase [Candidatus Bathyarchaeota archaeon]
MPHVLNTTNRTRRRARDMTSGKIVKFGVAGCGEIANVLHLPDLARNERARIACTCDLIAERARLTKELWHAEEYYTDFHTMLEKADIDAVVIATGMSSHGPLAIESAKAGKHFFVQKPLATNMNDANAVVEETRKSKVKGQVRPDTPLIPVYKTARNVIKEGTIGRPLWFSSGFGRDAPNWGAETFFSKEAGGPLFDLGVYSIAPITYLLGSAKRVVGLATVSIPYRLLLPEDDYTEHLAESVREARYLPWHPWRRNAPQSQKVKIEAEDNTFTLLDMGDGCLGVIVSNFVMLHGLRRPVPSPHIEIYGEEGGLIIGGVTGSSLSVLTTKKDSKYWMSGGPNEAGGWYFFGTIPQTERVNEMDHFIDCIVNDKEPLPSVEWGRHVSEIIIKSLESSRTGKALAIESTF